VRLKVSLLCHVYIVGVHNTEYAVRGDGTTYSELTDAQAFNDFTANVRSRPATSSDGVPGISTADLRSVSQPSHVTSQSTSQNSKSYRGKGSVSFALHKSGDEPKASEGDRTGDADRSSVTNPLSDLSMNDSFSLKPSSMSASSPLSVSTVASTSVSEAQALGSASMSFGGRPTDPRASARYTNSLSFGDSTANRDTTSTHSDISFSSPVAAQFRRLEVRSV
jgi:hypothetical protein